MLNRLIARDHNLAVVFMDETSSEGKIHIKEQLIIIFCLNKFFHILSATMIELSAKFMQVTASSIMSTRPIVASSKKMCTFSF